MVLDEIHKLARWKNILKGLFDEFNQAINIIVTGSARLDLFRRSGDSLAGRYTLVNLFPFSFREWAQITGVSFSWLHEEEDWKDPAAAFSKKLSGTSPVFKDIAEAYLTFGPFPAPLISGSMQRSRKWHRDYISLLIREDLRDLSGIRELDRVSHLVELLPDRIGSPLSLRSLAGDLEANHSTVKNWLLALQKLYLLWPLRPHSAKFQRTVRKEPKWYFLNWIYAGNKGSRFENMIATSLYRFVVSLSDRGWPEVKLHYLRTYDKKEIDFILFLNKKPILAVESKIMSKNIPLQLKQLRHNYDVDFPILQVVNQPGVLLKKGLNEPIIVIQKPNKAILVDGHHRAVAAKQLGIKELDAYILVMKKDIKLGLEETAEKKGIKRLDDITILDYAKHPLVEVTERLLRRDSDQARE